jgi:hypothetical protein
MFTAPIPTARTANAEPRIAIDAPARSLSGSSAVPVAP